MTGHSTSPASPAGILHHLVSGQVPEASGDGTVPPDDLADSTRSTFENIWDAVDAVPMALILVDASGWIVYGNQRAHDLFGYGRKEFVGACVDILVPERFRPAVQTHCQQFFANPVPRSIGVEKELLARRRDGTEFPAEIHLSPMPMPGQTLVVAGVLDATARLQAHQSLQESEGRLWQILNNSSAVVYLKDLQGRYLFVNRQFETLFNVTLETIRGKTDHDIFPLKMADQFRANDIAIAESGVVHQIEEVAPHADGPHTYVSVKFPLRGNDGRIQYLAGISTDITDRILRMQVENDIRDAREIQRFLYPRHAPTLSGFDITGATFPANQLCGDYFDFIPLSDGRLPIAVGDVSGHGLGPALHMVETRTYLRARLETTTDFQDVLHRLNDTLRNDLPEGMFVSLFFAVIDPESRILEYAGAGHDGLYFPAEGPSLRLKSTGPVLGLVPELFVDVRNLGVMQPGDLIVLPTDGFVETMTPDHSMFGWNRLVECVENHRGGTSREILDGLHAEVKKFAGAEAQKDDMSIVIVQAL